MNTGSAGSTLTYAIVGSAASIVGMHLDALAHLPHTDVVAMCDIDTEKGAERAKGAGCPFFTDHRELLEKVRPDIAVICTPHPLHARIAVDCFRAGAHVLVEKPIAVDTADADEMIAAADSAGRLLAVNFQERFRPAIEYARAFIAGGGMGSMLRVLSVEPWLRTAAYYRSAPWRGTWKGEGGGVLMNQAPHTLDLLCHLAGMPVRVWGVARRRVHEIQCEDSAHALLEYEGGAMGYVTVSTAEAGVDQRLEMLGDRALIQLVADQLSVVRFDPPLRQHIATAQEGLHQPRGNAERIDVPELTRPRHDAIHEDFQMAIRRKGKPRCDGRDARMSLELANAILLSSFTERPVDLPLDRPAYSKLLSRLRRESAD
ncbi:MAG TPA: Gfo/Idh/MocA family oxidoreductase [Polyangiaceae bacterium]